MSATGWLMVSGAVHVITDQKLTRTSLAALTGPTTLTQLAAAAGVAIAL